MQKHQPQAHDIAEQVTRFLQRGAVLADIRGLSERDMNAVYTLAYNQYDHGAYQRAETLFRFLCFYNHLEKKYFMGVGACRHMMRNYAGAVEAYAVAALLDADDPRPQVYTGESLSAQGDRGKAAIALEAAIECCDAHAHWEPLKNHASALLARLKQTHEEVGTCL